MSYLSEGQVVAGVLVTGSKVRLVDDDGGDPKFEQGTGEGQPEEGIPRLTPNADVAEWMEDGGVAEDGEQEPAPDGEAGGGVDGVQVGLEGGGGIGPKLPKGRGWIKGEKDGLDRNVPRE